LKDGETAVIEEMLPEGYEFEGKPRTSKTMKRGGGVGLMYRNTYEVQLNTSLHSVYTSFEYLCLSIRAESLIQLIILYRPTKSRKNNISVDVFLHEFEALLGETILLPGSLFFVGDFNIHCNKPEEKNVHQFVEILSSMDLQQHITEPTHKSGNTLDLIITRGKESSLVSTQVLPRVLSDHNGIICTLKLRPDQPKARQMTFRRLRKIDLASFAEDLHVTLTENISCIDAPTYIIAAKETLNKHAPEITRKVTPHTSKPWYNTDIHEARRLRRRYERMWYKTRLEVHHQMYTSQGARVVELIKQAKVTYYKDKLQSASPKDAFRYIHQLKDSQGKKLPCHQNAQDLADRFACFFTEKVATIRATLDSITNEQSQQHTAADRPTHEPPMFTLNTITQGDLSKIISTAPTKSCILDPIPTWLLKEKQVINVVLGPLLQIINASITKGVVPTCWKTAVITPLIKKPNLCPDILKNYRPVSNLPFLSKVLEKVIAKQLTSHMTRHGLHDPLQSAYRAAHSTETALLKIKDDIDRGLDQGEGTLLVLLDLSAAFDTIDHGILLDRLQHYVGISGTSLQWFQSYLQDRKQSVAIDRSLSTPQDLNIGVPQGSVLGPLLFLVYILPLADIIKRHGVLRHGYADDTQLYLRFLQKDTGQFFQAISKLESCIEDIRTWMTINKLKLNEDKTEFMIITSRFYKARYQQLNATLNVGGVAIKPVSSVRNLGTAFDCVMSMEGHVKNIKRSMFYHLKEISRVRRYLDRDTCHMAVQALVISRLDYANIMLVGLPQNLIHGLQIAQNAAARLITGTRREEHITPVLASLHWLPVYQRIKHKCLSLVYKGLHRQDAPKYLKDLLCLHASNRALRSGSQISRLSVQRTKNQYGDRAFSTTAPKLWNALSYVVHQQKTFDGFKRAVKSILFKEHFGGSNITSA
jgi:hypothetical protein